MTVIDQYLTSVTEPDKQKLTEICQLIRGFCPDLEETMSYGMPVFKYKGKYFIGICAFKDHLSLFPGAEAIEKLKDELSGFKTSKGTVQFTAQNPLPNTLITKILQLCQARIDAEASK